LTVALSKGWACPHARVSFEGDLLCVVGWSPGGIDYGSPDGIPASIIVMYLVPENQRNHYLREVSILAKAVMDYPGFEELRSARELNEVREHLLDLIASAKETVGPVTRARMIQLQARETRAVIPALELANLVVELVTIVVCPGMRHVVLTQNRSLQEYLDSAPGLVEGISTNGIYQNSEWRIMKRGALFYQADRVLYDCLAKTVSGGHRTQVMVIPSGYPAFLSRPKYKPCEDSQTTELSNFMISAYKKAAEPY
jgi:hypothetical protein